MNRQQFQRLRDIFLAAQDLPPEELALYLEQACKGDAELREHVKRLLDAAKDEDGFLLQPAMTLGEPDLPLHPGQIIGSCRLKRLIATGGMGTVYEAEQVDLGRTVAVKVMQSGLFTEAAVRRFEYEAEILARLRHPNIARVIESGTTGEGLGIPYFVMEFISGARPITEYAQEEGLSVRERLTLFLQVCDAVQYGHGRGVIHRDLKPSNILVDQEGQAKVIDFGVARATDADMTVTKTLTEKGQVIGTLQYMSPEQCLADPHDLDTRSDVYALGVVLYELVCEALPYDVSRAAMMEAVRLIREEPPRRPSAVKRILKGDIEDVLLKALEKDRDRRYQSLAEFESDITRYLRGEVILAKPASTAVRITKWIKRNPRATTAAIVSGLSVFAFIAYLMLWSLPRLQAETANAERAQAEAESARQDALEQGQVAETRYEEIVRLKDLKTLIELEEGSESLWPAYPENIRPLEDWIASAEELVSRRELHRQTLSTLREGALPYDEQAQTKNRASHEMWWEWQELHRSLEYASAKIEELEAIPIDSRSSRETTRLESLTELRTLREKEIAGLGAELEVRRVWDFTDPASKWQHDQLTDLCLRLDRLADEEKGLLKQVKTRREMARTVEEEFVDAHAATWEEAVTAIADTERSPLYNGLRISPQMGMVPLGPDPASGLWEFAHLQTGRVPRRMPDGSLEITEETGLVFVLIPGGSFEMGAERPSDTRPLGSPNVDPEASDDQGPVHTVTLGPFLMSKYEMTQGQWLRFTGSNPSYYHPDRDLGKITITLRHPVECVSWEDCRRELHRMKLRLPTEAEWEYAVRAGTSTIWWTGDDIEAMDGKANFFDQGDRPLRPREERLWNDPYLRHAPVGLFPPNPFGLHNVFGNIVEWCQDGYGSYRDAPTDGSAHELPSEERRIIRGTSFHGKRLYARSAARHTHGATMLDRSVGVRPAASLH